MQQDFDVLVVSAYGRGNWLAADLRSRGISVLMMDVSDQLGNWSPEDWEGPFGYFTDETLSPLQAETLQAGDSPILLNTGFTIWEKNGPIEFKSVLTPYRLKNEAWIRSFFKSYSKIHFQDRVDAVGELEKKPTMMDFYFRRASRMGMQKSIQWVESKSVKVLSKVSVSDLSIDEKKMAGSVEYRSDRPAMQKAAQFVWCLSSEETGMLGASIREKIFGKFQPEMIWSWLRFRIRMDSSLVRDQLPSHLVVVEDVHLPWTHENCFILQRTFSQEQFDLWMLLPTAQRFNKQYLLDRADRVKALLSARLPAVNVLMQDLPQEYAYTYNQIGPSRFGSFGKDLRSSARKMGLKNLHVVGPETWTDYLPQSNFEAQRQVIEEIEKWWNNKEEQRKKIEEKKQKAVKGK